MTKRIAPIVMVSMMLIAPGCFGGASSSGIKYNPQPVSACSEARPYEVPQASAAAADKPAKKKRRNKKKNNNKKRSKKAQNSAQAGGNR